MKVEGELFGKKDTSGMGTEDTREGNGGIYDQSTLHIHMKLSK
jgi:hypothetical protein